MSDKKLNEGATIWARQTVDSEIFYYKPDKWFKIWFYIVNKVNHKDTRLFKRGTNLITYREIREATKATKNQIDKFIRWAKETTMIETRKTTRGMVVTVKNYNTYQDLSNYERDIRDDTTDDLQTKWRRNGDDTINKNDKNERMKEYTLSSKNDKKTDDFEIVKDHWNSFAKQHGLPEVKKLSQKRISNIKARYKEDEFDLNVIMEEISKSSFLLGQNNNGWAVDFDWIFGSTTNYLKILEGKYKDKKGNNNGTHRTIFETDEFRERAARIFESIANDPDLE